MSRCQSRWGHIKVPEDAGRQTALLAIAGHANGVEGGLAAYLRGNLVKLLRSLASDEAIAAIPGISRGEARTGSLELL